MHAYFESNEIINTGKLHEQIVKNRYGPKFQDCIMKKYKWTRQQFDSIDWPSVQTTFNQKIFWQQTKISKAAYSWLPTMARLHNITPT